jgi:ribosomal-protein-alanine N-acetyltransferase
MRIAHSVIETERLELVPATIGDARDLFPIAKDPASIEDFQHVASKLKDVESWLSPSIDEGTPTWTIRLDGRVIGLMEAEIRKNAIADIGYFVDSTHQNQGYATEAIKAVVEWLFESTPVHRVEAGVTARNTPSRRVVEKLGFKLEGIARKNWPWGDAWFDSANYALLKEEWAAKELEAG